MCDILTIARHQTSALSGLTSSHTNHANRIYHHHPTMPNTFPKANLTSFQHSRETLLSLHAAVTAHARHVSMHITPITFVRGDFCWL
jgi:hypothetical protein